MRQLTPIIILLGALLACSSDSGAVEENMLVACQPRQSIAKQLEDERYREAVVGIAITAENQLVHLWRSQDGLTWTITVTFPATGNACLLTFGRYWVDIPWMPKREGSL